MGPLDITVKTSTAKTGIPIIPQGAWVEFKLESIVPEQGEKGIVTKWKWTTTHPVSDENGKTLAVGFPFFENIQFYDKNTSPENPGVPEWAAKKISVRLDGLLGTGDEGNNKGYPVRPDFSGDLIPNLIGKIIRAEMKKRTGEYEGNEFGKIVHPAHVAA